MMLALYYGIFFLLVYPCFALCAVVPPCIVPWPYPNPTLFGSVPMFPLLCVGQSNPHIFIFLTIQVFGLVSLFYKNEILIICIILRRLFPSACSIFLNLQYSISLYCISSTIRHYISSGYLYLVVPMGHSILITLTSCLGVIPMRPSLTSCLWVITIHPSITSCPWVIPIHPSVKSCPWVIHIRPSVTSCPMANGHQHPASLPQ